MVVTRKINVLLFFNRFAAESGASIAMKETITGFSVVADNPNNKIENDLICTIRMNILDWLLGLEILAENLNLITISNKSTVNLYIGNIHQFYRPEIFPD